MIYSFIANILLILHIDSRSTIFWIFFKTMLKKNEVS